MKIQTMLGRTFLWSAAFAALPFPALANSGDAQILRALKVAGVSEYSYEPFKIYKELTPYGKWKYQPELLASIEKMGNAKGEGAVAVFARAELFKAETSNASAHWARDYVRTRSAALSTDEAAIQERLSKLRSVSHAWQEIGGVLMGGSGNPIGTWPKPLPKKCVPQLIGKHWTICPIRDPDPSAAFEPRLFPSVVRLLWGSKKCSGVLVSDILVLTASHCLPEEDSATGTVEISAPAVSIYEKNPAGEVVYAGVKSISIPLVSESIKARGNANLDLAILKLSTSAGVTVSKINFFPLEKFNPVPPVMAAGFGFSAYSDSNKSNPGLEVGNISTDANPAIFDLSASEIKFTNVAAKVVPPGTMNIVPAPQICDGDSGGPLYLGNTTGVKAANQLEVIGIAKSLPRSNNCTGTKAESQFVWLGSVEAKAFLCKELPTLDGCP